MGDEGVLVLLPVLQTLFPALRTLDLTNNTVTCAVAASVALHALPHVHTLRLFNNRIADAGECTERQ